MPLLFAFSREIHGHFTIILRSMLGDYSECKKLPPDVCSIIRY